MAKDEEGGGVVITPAQPHTLHSLKEEPVESCSNLS
jgi:hypothetical protein